MNEKFLTYEKAKKELKKLEQTQLGLKKARRLAISVSEESLYSSELSKNTKKINKVLNIIQLHKELRKMGNILNSVLVILFSLILILMIMLKNTLTELKKYTKEIENYNCILHKCRKYIISGSSLRKEIDNILNGNK